MTRLRRLALAVAVLALAAPTPVAAQVNVTTIEAEVMCPVCGTLLELSESPQAEREKAFVRRLIAEGRSRGEIKDALVSQYGPAVLALPEGRGFDLSAYLVPVVAFVLFAAALAVAVVRWRRGGGGGRAGGAPRPPSGERAERLDADMSRYDL